MKITMLGTGNATVTECYNTCFVLSGEGKHLLVDGGGGNTVLRRLKQAGTDWKDIRDIFVTHKHIDHLLGIIWMARMICQNMSRGTYDGEARIYAHDEVIALIDDMARKLLGAKESAFIGKRLHLITVGDGEEREIIGRKFAFFDILSTKAKQYGFCMDLGGLTAFLYGFRDREKILDMLEETCGGRLIQNYNCIGGVMADIHPNLVKRIKDFIKYLPPMLKEYHGLFTGNIIAQQRMKHIGILSREDAISYGVTGPSGRGSGWACDVRKIHPYGVYDKVDFNEVLYTEGDTFSRYMVRMDEIVESLHILEQLVDNIPAGDYAVKTKPIIKLPEGQYFKSVEAARGEFGVFIESHGDKYPYRLKFRSPGLPLVSVVDLLASHNKIADLIAIGGSLDYVVPDIDR